LKSGAFLGASFFGFALNDKNFLPLFLPSLIQPDSQYSAPLMFTDPL